MKQWWNKKEIDNKQVPSRYQKMTTPELLLLMENMLMTLGPTFDDWRFKSGPALEVTACLGIMDVLWLELQNRQ